MNLPLNYRKGKQLETLVENRTKYSLRDAELNIFETHQHAEKVLLDFSQPTLASMLKGKKIMKLRDKDPFPFLPGESIMLPSNELMNIDFPEASKKNPTKCLAMVISEEQIKTTIDRMNEDMARQDTIWKLKNQNFHFSNDLGIYQILNRLLFLFTEDHNNKDLFVDMALQELIIRLLQTESYNSYVSNSNHDENNNRIAFVVNYIRENISNKLSVKELSKKAYLSESQFYRVFKNELGVTPVDFINEIRVNLASSLLHDPTKKVKEIYLQCGFNSLSYFSRIFKRKFSMTPSEYQDHLKEISQRH